jgi:hypothetical protein
LSAAFLQSFRAGEHSTFMSTFTEVPSYLRRSDRRPEVDRDRRGIAHRQVLVQRAEEVGVRRSTRGPSRARRRAAGRAGATGSGHEASSKEQKSAAMGEVVTAYCRTNGRGLRCGALHSQPRREQAARRRWPAAVRWPSSGR